MKIPLFFVLTAVLFQWAQGYNGSLENFGDIQVVNLWGTWEEMGYAHGRMLGPDLMELYDGYFLELAGGLSNVEILRNGFTSYFDVPQEFREYAAGIIEGTADTISIWSAVYGRELDTLDIYITSSVPDLSAMVDMPALLCSSASAWDVATAGDTALQGSPAISRNLDYYVDQNCSILGMSRLFVYDPLEGHDWISVSFPGFMGSLSGMNEAGLNASLNMGNYSGTSQTSPAFVPICMALTLGLCLEDFDESGTHDVEDLTSAATFWNRANSYDIHVTSPVDLSAGEDPAVVVEVNNHQGFAFRYSQDEPSITPYRLLLTNHHRVLYPPVSCWRYQLLLDSLEVDPNLSLERLWNLMGSVSFPPVPGTGGTLQTMIFQPEERRMGLAFASEGVSAPQKPPQWIEWSDLYPNHDPQGTQPGPEVWGMELLQNPVRSVLSVFTESNASLKLYDLNGREMDAGFTEFAPGMFRADVSGLPRSVYIIQAKLGTISTCRQVLVL